MQIKEYEINKYIKLIKKKKTSVASKEDTN